MLEQRRQEKGLSQRELARRSGIAYKTIQLIESGRDCRWSTLTRLAKALNVSDPRELVGKGGPWTAAQAAVAVHRAAQRDWTTPFFDFVDDFRRSPGPEKVAQAPDTGAGTRALALVASTVEQLCAERGMPPPWWCSAAPGLAEPWFVSEMESLKASALAESPAAYRQRNIFVLGNFLSRA